jgi:hypothetical protein
MTAHKEITAEEAARILQRERTWATEIGGSSQASPPKPALVQPELPGAAPTKTSAAKAYWQKLTPEARLAEGRRRAAKAMDTKAERKAEIARRRHETRLANEKAKLEAAARQALEQERPAPAPSVKAAPPVPPAPPKPPAAESAPEPEPRPRRACFENKETLRAFFLSEEKRLRGALDYVQCVLASLT